MIAACQVRRPSRCDRSPSAACQTERGPLAPPRRTAVRSSPLRPASDARDAPRIISAVCSPRDRREHEPRRSVRSRRSRRPRSAARSRPRAESASNWPAVRRSRYGRSAGLVAAAGAAATTTAGALAATTAAALLAVVALAVALARVVRAILALAAADTALVALVAFLDVRLDPVRGARDAAVDVLGELVGFLLGRD